MLGRLISLFRKDDVRTYDAVAKLFPKDWENLKTFERPEWLEASENYVKKLRADAKAGTLVPEAYLDDVVRLASAVVAEKGRVTITDLGGGIGPCIDPIICKLPPGSFSYTVHDGPQNCETGRRLFADTPGLVFNPKMVPFFGLDIALMSSALQYIEDWQGALGALLDLKPRYLCMPRLPIRSETIAVRQNIRLGAPPKSIGKVWHWVFGRSLDEFIAARGYEKTYDEPIRDLTAEMAEANAGPAELRVRTYRAI